MYALENNTDEVSDYKAFSNVWCIKAVPFSACLDLTHDFFCVCMCVLPEHHYFIAVITVEWIILVL